MSCDLRHFTRYVATEFRCGGTYDYYFITSLLPSESVLKEFLKSVNIWQS